MTEKEPIALVPRFLVMLAMTALLFGCGPGYLDAGGKIPATEINRQIFNVLQAYHKAMEDRDVETIKKMVSKRYYENGGTTDVDKDDYGVDRLSSAVLPRLRSNVKRVQFKIKLLSIKVQGATASAEYEYFGRALLSEGVRDSYKMWNDFAQMQFVRENGRWLISRGL